MNVTCAGCKRSLNVPDSFAGKTIACPACKRPLKVPDELQLAPEDVHSADDQAALGMSRAPAAPGLPGTCRGCGFPIPANKKVCNRCGMNVETGQQDADFVGYQASSWQKTAGVRGKVLGAVIAVALIAVVIIVVQLVRGWASTVATDGDASSGKTGRGTSRQTASKPAAARPAAAKPDAAKPAAARPDAAKPAATPAAAKPPATPAAKPTAASARARTDITDAFEEAFAMLIDPVPAVSVKGASRIQQLGVAAVPHLIRKIQELKETPLRVASIKALARFRSADAVAVLIALLGDENYEVRQGAVSGLVTQGRGISDGVGAALKEKEPRTRIAAIRVIDAAKLGEHTNAMLEILKGDESPEVRQEAAVALGAGLAGEATLQPLVAALDDESADVTFAAAEALANQTRAASVLGDALAKDAGGNDEARFSKLFVVGWPILASGDVALAKALAKRVCSEKPIPAVVEACSRLLASGNAIVSRDCIRQATGEKDFQPPTSIAALMSVMSPDNRIAAAAASYAYAMPELTFVTPLIASLGSKDTAFAVSNARILAEKKNVEVTAALKRAAKGVNAQRATLAAVALALQGDDSGIDMLKRVASGEIPMMSPIPGLAAYGYATSKSDMTAQFFETYRAAGEAADQLYFCGAAARGKHAEAVESLRAMLGDRRLGPYRIEVARMLAEMNDRTSQDALLTMLRESDDTAQVAAARALGRLGDIEIVPKLLREMAVLQDQAREEARAVIVGFGAKTETYLAAALGDEDPRMQTAALEVIGALGRSTPKELLKQLGILLQNMKLPARTQEAVKEAVVAVTGTRPEAGWTWRDWVKVCGVRPGELVDQLELEQAEWAWVSMLAPKGWERNTVSCMSLFLPGAPSVSFTQEFDAVTADQVKGFWEPQHMSLKDFERHRMQALAMTSPGKDKWVPRPSAKLENMMAFNIGPYPSATFRITDAETQRTTYYVLVWMRLPTTYWYLEAAFSADSADYDDYKKLFETKLARSIRLNPREVKLDSKK